jgi:hypothetical protein
VPDLRAGSRARQKVLRSSFNSASIAAVTETWSDAFFEKTT